MNPGQRLEYAIGEPLPAEDIPFLVTFPIAAAASVALGLTRDRILVCGGRVSCAFIVTFVLESRVRDALEKTRAVVQGAQMFRAFIARLKGETT